MTEVYGNRPNNFGRNHRNASDQSADSADDTILAGTIMELEFQCEGDYEERVKSLEETVKLLKERESQLLREFQDLQSSNDQLTQATIENQGHIDKLSTENKQLRDAEREKDQVITSLQAEVNELRAKVNELEAKVNELQAKVNELKICECGRDKLYLCQVAVEFEGAICYYVLPEVFSASGNAKFEDLLYMLNSGDEESVPLDPDKDDIKTILSGARERWEKVCTVLNLPPEWKESTGEKKVKFYRRSDPDIFRAIAILKHARNFVAHPSPVTVQIAEEAIKTDAIKSGFKRWEYKLVQDFILSLRANIEKIGIHQDRLKIE